MTPPGMTIGAAATMARPSYSAAPGAVWGISVFPSSIQQASGIVLPGDYYAGLAGSAGPRIAVIHPGQQLMFSGGAASQSGAADAGSLQALAMRYWSDMQGALSHSGPDGRVHIERVAGDLRAMAEVAPDRAPDYYADAIARLEYSNRSIAAGGLAAELALRRPSSAAAMIATGATNGAPPMMATGYVPSHYSVTPAVSAHASARVVAPLDTTISIGGGQSIIGLEYSGPLVDGLAEGSLLFALKDARGNDVGSVRVFYPDLMSGGNRRVGVELSYAMLNRRDLRVALAERFGVRPGDVDISDGLAMMSIGAGYYVAGDALGTRTIVLNEDIDAPRAAMIAHYLEWWRIGELEVEVDGDVFKMTGGNGPYGLVSHNLRRGDVVTFRAEASAGEMLLARIAALNEAGWFSPDVKHPDVLRIVKLAGENPNAELAGVALDMMRNLHVDGLNAVYSPGGRMFAIASSFIDHEELEGQLGATSAPFIRLRLSEKYGDLWIESRSTDNTTEAERAFQQAFAPLFAGVRREVGQSRSTGGLPDRVDHAALGAVGIDAQDGRAVENAVDLMMQELNTGELAGVYIPETSRLIIGDPRLHHAELAERFGVSPRTSMIRLHISGADSDAFRVISFDDPRLHFDLDPNIDPAQRIAKMPAHR